ncbi:MAG: ABC transporter permease subunit [Nocardioidaceae bacterium]|nr:ABC transporter permease subunit [Nocardioidaceae bacterium]
MSRRARLAVASFYVLLLGAWEVYGRLAYEPGKLLPPPTTILRTLWEMRDAYLRDAWVTVQEAGLGLLVGVVLGLGIALLVDRFARMGEGIYRLALVLYSVPLIALAPALVSALGIGLRSKVAIAALAAFFPVVVNVTTALRSVDRRVLELGRLLSVGRWRTLRFMRMPYALPALFAALKIAGPAAVIAAMIAEWVGAERGLGLALLYAMFGFQLPNLWAILLLSTLMTGFAFAVFEVLGRVATPWHASAQRGER